MKNDLNINSPLYKFLLATFRANPDFFLETIRNSKRSDIEINFNEIIRSLAKNHVEMGMLPQFNNEIVSAFELKALYKWESVSNDNVSSPFQFLKRYAEYMLILRKDNPFYHINRTNIWNYLTFELGEDLFTTTLHADNYIKHGIEPEHFQWNYHLHSTFTSLNSLISRRKIVENHSHLNGSSPNVDLSWLFLMNNPIGQKAKFKNFEKEYALEQSLVNTNTSFHQTGLHLLAIIAAYIRIRLYEECCIGHDQGTGSLWNVLDKIRDIGMNETVIYNDYLLGMINTYKFKSPYQVRYKHANHAVDYAITDFRKRADLNYLEIAGERHFYYCCLKKIFKYDAKSPEIQVLFYLYLLIKGKFNGIFIQRNKKYGFDNFHRYQSPKLDIIGNTLYEEIAVKMAIKYNFAENYLEKLEARIAPAETTNLLGKKIVRADLYSKEDHRKFFYVIHFIKNKKSDWGTEEINKSIPFCRESKLRAKLKRQAEIIEKIRQETRDHSFRIYGIDAASHEVNCRPENFGQVFRFLSDLRQSYPYLHHDPGKVHLPDLKKTFHVGEDFYDIIDGLRSVDEAILFLQLKYGDRIGHGVALGIDPVKYYSNRKIIPMPLQNALDNTAWMMYCIQKFQVNISTSFYTHLKFNFDSFYNLLHQQPASKIRNTPADLISYIKAWKLRGDNPACYVNEYSRLTRIEKKQNLDPVTRFSKYNFTDRLKYHHIEQNVYNLYHSYHFDYSLKDTAQEIVEIEIGSEYVNLVKQIQVIMRNLLLRKGVSVESNPSSNFLISNFDSTNELPVFKLFPIKEADNDFVRLNTSINTDDQGIFYTSLVKEYTLLADALRSEVNSSGMRKYSDDNILDWIDNLIYNGKEQCFMQDNSL